MHCGKNNGIGLEQSKQFTIVLFLKCVHIKQNDREFNSSPSRMHCSCVRKEEGEEGGYYLEKERMGLGK